MSRPVAVDAEGWDKLEVQDAWLGRLREVLEGIGTNY
jgi:hypothetical protein